MKEGSMAARLKLPMGIEDFEEIRTSGYCYVNKTGLLKTLLENPGKVKLFICSRCFGKTMNTSKNEKCKYYCFFENILL